MSTSSLPAGMLERNTLRANLVERAEQRRWSSLYRRGNAEGRGQIVVGGLAAGAAPTLIVARERCGNREPNGGLASLGQARVSVFK